MYVFETTAVTAGCLKAPKGVIAPNELTTGLSMNF